MFNFIGKEKGQGLVEYALILVLIAIVVIAAMQALGTSVDGTFSNVNSALGMSAYDGPDPAAEAFCADKPDGTQFTWYTDVETGNDWIALPYGNPSPSGYQSLDGNECGEFY